MLEFLSFCILTLSGIVLGSEVIDPDASIIDVVPEETLSDILGNLSSYQLTKAARVSKRFNTICKKMIIDKYKSDYYAIGLDYFAPETQVIEKNSLVKFMKLEFDHHLVDEIFNDNPQEIETPFPDSCDLLQNIPILKVALKQKKFKAPLFIHSHEFLAELFDDIYNSKVPIKMNRYTVRSYIQHASYFNWRRFRKLIKRSSSHLEFYPEIEALIASGCVSAKLLARSDYVDFSLMLRIGTIKDLPLFEQFSGTYNMENFLTDCCVSGLNLNTDREFVFNMVNILRKRMDARYLCSFSHHLIKLDLPKLYVWLYGFELSDFEDDNIKISIEKYGTSQSQTINFVNCAIVLGKPDNMIIGLMKNFKCFACDISGFYSTPFIVGMSNDLASAFYTLGKPVSGVIEPMFNYSSLNPRIQANLQKLDVKLVYLWLERFAKLENQSVQEAIFTSFNFLSSTEQLREVLDLMVNNGAFALDISKDMVSESLPLIVQAFDSREKLVILMFYPIFKSHLPVSFNNEKVVGLCAELPIYFDAGTLDDYILAVKDSGAESDSYKIAKIWRSYLTN